MTYKIINKAENASVEFINEDYIYNLFTSHSGYKQMRMVAVVIEPNNENACAEHTDGYVYSSEDKINISEIEHSAWNGAWEVYNCYVKSAWVSMYGDMDADELNDWFTRDAKYVAENYVVIDIDMSDEI